MGPFFPVKEFLSQIIYEIIHIRPAGDKERPTSIWEARVQAPSKPEFFSGFFFCNFFNCSLPARINSLLITRRSNMNYFIYYL